MRFVKITHPDVGEATVPEISVPNLIPRGWVLVDDEADAEPATVTDEPAPPAPSTPPTERARARMSHEES